MGKGSGLAQEFVEIFIHVGHPVAREQELVLARDRALEAHHGVHPRGVLRLYEKLGIGAVLAAAVGDAIVDDHDLAMVAEVDAALERSQQGVADRQACGHAHACRAHRLPMLGADHRARAEVIGHGPAGHAAGGRALQGLDDLAAVVVRQPDVEQHMDVIRGGIDVGHHRVDRGVGVRQQARRVATHGLEPADRVAEPKEMPVTFGNGGRRTPPRLQRNRGSAACA